MRLTPTMMECLLYIRYAILPFLMPQDAGDVLGSHTTCITLLPSSRQNNSMKRIVTLCPLVRHIARDCKMSSYGCDDHAAWKARRLRSGEAWSGVLAAALICAVCIDAFYLHSCKCTAQSGIYVSSARCGKIPLRALHPAACKSSRARFLIVQRLPMRSVDSFSGA